MTLLDSIRLPPRTFHRDSRPEGVQRCCDSFRQRRSNLSVLLDYSAAFDTVDHSILLTILKESFGITGSVLAWIRSFLTDRHQIFQVGSDRSPMVIVLYGLPQGTILGPQMYILYTVDLESILERHGVKMHLYADDTQLYHHSRTNNLEQAMVKFEACLEDCGDFESVEFNRPDNSII